MDAIEPVNLESVLKLKIMKLETLNLVELNESEKIDTSGGFFGWFILGLFIGWILSGGEVTTTQ